MLLGTDTYAKRIISLYWPEKWKSFTHFQLREDLAYIQISKKNFNLYRMNKEILGRVKILKTRLKISGILSRAKKVPKKLKIEEKIDLSGIRLILTKEKEEKIFGENSQVFITGDYKF